MIQFGICNPLANHEIAATNGCDYLECGVSELLPLIPEDDSPEVEERMAEFAASALPVKAFSGFIPAELKVTGPEVEWGRISGYLDTALRRAHRVGGETVVWGSGPSRQVADGFVRETAEEQVVRFLHLAGHWAEKHSITIAIEPLNTKESNIVNSVSEGVNFAERVAHPRIRVLADFYHMQEESESTSVISKYAPWLNHIHTADSGRLYAGSGNYPYDEFVAEVNKAGYQGMISVECRWGADLAAEIAASMEFLKSRFPD